MSDENTTDPPDGRTRDRVDKHELAEKAPNEIRALIPRERETALQGFALIATQLKQFRFGEGCPCAACAFAEFELVSTAGDVFAIAGAVGLAGYYVATKQLPLAREAIARAQQLLKLVTQEVDDYVELVDHLFTKYGSTSTEPS